MEDALLSEGGSSSYIYLAGSTDLACAPHQLSGDLSNLLFIVQMLSVSLKYMM